MRGRLALILAASRFITAWFLALLTLVLCVVLFRSAIASDLYTWQTGSPETTLTRHPGRGMFNRLRLYELETGWGGLTLRHRGNERYDGSFILYQRNGFHHISGEPSYARVPGRQGLSQPPQKLGLPWLGAGWGDLHVGLQPVAIAPEAPLPRHRTRPETYFVTDRWYAWQVTLPLPLLILLAGLYPALRLWRWRRSGGRGFPVAVGGDCDAASAE